jgi:hypothetical protein
MSDLEQAVDGFRRAEAALAAITSDAKELAEAGAEAEQARVALAAAGEDLKMVAGALVGLASAHKELVTQLSTAASALRRPGADGPFLEATEAEPAAVAALPASVSGSASTSEPAPVPVPVPGEGILVALRDAEVSRAEQVGEVLGAVEELSRRVDAAITDRVGEALERLTADLPNVGHIEALSVRLDAIVADRGLEEMLDQIDRLANSDSLAVLDERLGELVRVGQELAGTREVLTRVEERLEALDPAIIVGRVDGATGRRLEELERTLTASQRRIYELVAVEGLAFLVLAALLAFLALR